MTGDTVLPQPRRARIVVATTVMLSFISFWRAAAIVLNDLASSAYYAGGIAGRAAGKAAPWFILGVMLFSYAVRAVYVESCAMFTRGGVYRVVKEALGGTLAKFSVSALMFDYILTGPISGVVAGQYIVGFAADTLTYFGHPWHPSQTNENHLAAVFCIAVTLYYWWRNIQGIHESSEDAMRIMKITTVMVVIVMLWCGYTLLIQGPKQLPTAPTPQHLVFDEPSTGWLPKLLPHSFQQTPAPYQEGPEPGRFYSLMHGAGYWLGLLGMLIAFGHAVLAMSGEESLAQVNRELEHPKHLNLMRAGSVIFVYSLVFTAGVSILASLLISDADRPKYFDNLISGLAMNVVGPFPLRLLLQGFVVVVGFLILTGAINTAIVGSNGVLNRVSEDGVLTDWFRAPHGKHGTTYRMINMVVILQLVTVVGSGGDVQTLGNAYAFGVVWSFAFKALSVLVLRYKDKSQREWKVPFNFHIKGVEIPAGLGAIVVVLFAIAVVNLFTKQDATIVGGAFTAGLFVLFTISEKVNARRRAEHKEMDQFRLNYQDTVTQENADVRPGNVLVAVRDYNTLEHLRTVLARTDTESRDVVVLTTRIVRGGDFGGELAIEENLFSEYEQLLFSRVVALAEKLGKPVSLLVVPGNNPYDAMMLTAQRLQSYALVLGPSSKANPAEQARMAGIAWENLPHPRPALQLEVVDARGESRRFLMGPHAPDIRPEDVETLHRLWLELSAEPDLRNLHHYQVVTVALRRLAAGLRRREDRDIIREELRKLASAKPGSPDERR